MQINFEKQSPDFEPLEIKFTVKSQEELDKLAALFNHVDVQEFLNVENINEEFERHGASPSKYLHRLFDKIKSRM